MTATSIYYGLDRLVSGRVHAFGADAMLHRVSLEADAKGGVDAVYSNSWIQPPRQTACGPSGGAGDLLTGGLALPRLLILAAMASLVGVELPTTERTAAGGTSVVQQVYHLCHIIKLHETTEKKTLQHIFK